MSNKGTFETGLTYALFTLEFLAQISYESLCDISELPDIRTLNIGTLSLHEQLSHG
jgi:hypothetical protein